MRIYSIRTVELTDVLGEYIPRHERFFEYDGPLALAAITGEVCNSFKTQVLMGCHNFDALSGTASAVAAGTGVYTITLTGGASNGLAGRVFVCAGFGTGGNNGSFLCTASDATHITLANPSSANSGAMGTCTSGDVFKVALYPSTATLNKSTTNYSATGECGTSGTYTTGVGGAALTSVTPVLSTDTAVCDFADISFTTATITARGCLISNSSKVIGAAGGAACFVLDFGADKTSTGGTFAITWPAAAAGTAVYGLA